MANNDKIKKELGFSPQFSNFREGIAEVLKHYSLG